MLIVMPRYAQWIILGCGHSPYGPVARQETGSIMWCRVCSYASPVVVMDRPPPC